MERVVCLEFWVDCGLFMVSEGIDINVMTSQALFLSDAHV